MNISKEELKKNLAQFIGTENYHHYPFVGNITDGVKYLAENARCYWLLDYIGSQRINPKIARYLKKESFLCIKIELQKNNSARIIIDDGNNNVLHKEDIAFTDFPLDKITLFYDNNNHVLMLNTEY